MKYLKRLNLWIYIGILLVPFLGRAVDSTSSSFWRVPLNGGINCLYCLLHIYAIDCSYSNLWNEQSVLLDNGQQQTAASLVKSSRENGLKLVPMSLTFHNLLELQKPVLVHINSDTPDNGAFILVLSATNDIVIYFNGPSSTIHSMSIEEFRQIWSGIALVPDHYSFHGWYGLSSGIAMALCIFEVKRLKQK